jgi:hypothetical protein
MSKVPSRCDVAESVIRRAHTKGPPKSHNNAAVWP